MSKLKTKYSFFSILFNLFVAFFSYNSAAQNVQEGHQLDEQIHAAQQAAQAMQKQISPNVNADPNRYPGKMKDMRKMQITKPVMTRKATSKSIITTPVITVNKINGMKKGSMGKKKMMNRMPGMNLPMSRKSQKMMGSKMGAFEDKSALAELPAFPGNTHIYHLGADDFFLDKADTITLSDVQREQLLQLQSIWQSNNQDLENKISQAEQMLWLMTAEDVPIILQIKTKIDEIAQLQAKQRIGFIQIVGKAANVLSDEQRQTLSAKNSSLSVNQNN